MFFLFVETKEEKYKGERERRQSKEEEARGGAAGSLEMVGTLEVFRVNASSDFYFTFFFSFLVRDFLRTLRTRPIEGFDF